MEWIETTARTVEEALDQALDKLGVDEDEVEFEVIEEPKAGLFGRVRGQARLRARVEPRAPRAKTERRERRRPKSKGSDKSGAAVAADAGSDKSSTGDNGDSRPSRRDRPRSGQGRPNRDAPSDLPDLDDAAVTERSESFLVGLVQAFGCDANVESSVSDNTLELNVDGQLGLLVGPKARTMDAVQELTRTVVQRAGNSDLRIRVDVGNYRQVRREALEDYAAAALERFQETGEEVALEVMPPADRKVVHDALSDAPGITTRSDGREPRRRIIIGPAD